MNESERLRVWLSQHPELKDQLSALAAWLSVRHGARCSVGANRRETTLALSCVLPGEPELDLLDLTLEARDANGVWVEVCWGHPSGFIEFELLLPADVATNSARVREAIQNAGGALDRALTRGRPAE